MLPLTNNDVLGLALAGSGLSKPKPDPELRARPGLTVPDQETGQSLIDLCKFVCCVFDPAIIFDTMVHLFIKI